MKQLTVLTLLVLLFSCAKETATNPAENEIPSSQSRTWEPGTCDAAIPKTDQLRALTESILKTAKWSPDFKKFVYSRCAEQPYGDYYIKVSDLISYNAENNYAFWGEKQAEYIQCLVNNIMKADSKRPEEPIIFVPFLEDRNVEEIISGYAEKNPEGVVGDEYDRETEECLSYVIGEDERLTKVAPRNEEYAWKNDLWVINQEEVVDETSPVLMPPSIPEFNRFNGQTEKGGIINVTNIGQIESWINGKVELKFFVFSQSGAKTNEIATGKTKRNDVKNKWKDFNYFLFYWNTSNIGNYIIEAWIEQDGGSTTTVSQNIPAPCTGCPSTSISYTTKNDDDLMGQSIIQFTDGIWTEYNISYAKIKHKN